MSSRDFSNQAPARAGLVLVSVLLITLPLAVVALVLAWILVPSQVHETTDKQRVAELLATYHAEDAGGRAVPAEPVAHPQS